MKIEDHKSVLEAVLDVPTFLKVVSLAPKNIIDRVLIMMKIRRGKEQALILSALTMRTNYKLTYLIADLVTGSNQKGEMEKILEVINLNTFLMANIVATAIHNKNSKTPDYLVDTVLDNFSQAELKIAIKEVYRRLDVQTFFECLTSLRTLSLFENIQDQTPLGQLSEE